MKVLNIVKSVISYLCAFFAGLYVFGFTLGEFDFFRILGCVMCVLVAVATSPLMCKVCRAMPGRPPQNAQKSVKNLDRFVHFTYCIFLRMCYNSITVKGRERSNDQKSLI